MFPHLFCCSAIAVEPLAPHQPEERSQIEETAATAKRLNHVHVKASRKLGKYHTAEKTTEEDRRVLHNLLEEHGPDQKTKVRMRKLYDQFCVLNGYSFQEGYGPFAAQMLRHDLAPSSVCTYMKHVFGGHPRGGENWRVLAALNNLAAEADTTHAKDGSRAELIFAIRVIESPEYQALAWLMMATGGRACDLARLRRLQFHITKNRRGEKTVCIEWRRTKGIHHRAHRKFVRYSLKHMPPCPKRGLDYLTTVRLDHDMLFTDKPRFAADKLNNALRAAIGKGKFTSYSFRRAFMFQTLKDCKGDYEAAKKFTLHRDAATTMAFYTEWLVAQEK
jgi:integrase